MYVCMYINMCVCVYTHRLYIIKNEYIFKVFFLQTVNHTKAGTTHSPNTMY